MGLDMYLTKEYYVKTWEHEGAKKQHQITTLKGGKPSTIPTDKITGVTVEVMTWRKANAIHGWFVQNVQDGEDDYGYYYVSKGQLRELLATVKEVLEDNTTAVALLPIVDEPFYGSENYDEKYYRDLEFTKEALTEALKVEDDGDFKYHSIS